MKNKYLCSACDEIKRMADKVLRPWDETGEKDVYICKRCAIFMKKNKIKYVLTFVYYQNYCPCGPVIGGKL